LDKDAGSRYADPAVSEYLKRQLIAYIGNKRALLPFLTGLFERLVPNGRAPGVFLDAFAGSGSVARLARTLGYEVHANDWEPYAHAMNRAFLTLTPTTATRAFAPLGGLDSVLLRLNNLTAPVGEEFIARWYAPRSTQTADWRTERLFYTRENALWLDAVREQIDELCPDDGPARSLLLALLVYEASVHSNTSGVFKAFHKGFGGHGGDALGRILAKMELEHPVLFESPRRATASALDAHVFLRGRSADVVYLDPPYNQHQYGSNYHLLNTVVLGDRFVPERKAGIRRDWVKTKSAFCSKATAAAALASVLDAADARHLVVSYSTEGVVPFDQLYDLLDRRGRVELAVSDYVTYRGGRQSPARRTHNLEFVLVVDTASSAGTGQKTAIDRFRAERRLATLLKGSFVPRRLCVGFEVEGSVLLVDGRRWPTDSLYRFETAPDLEGLSLAALERAAETLAAAACRNHQEEAAVLEALLASTPPGALRVRRVRRLALVLRKFAFRQYQAEFEAALERARGLKLDREDDLLPRLLDELASVAQRRFAPK
jgi:adenine-specific DNA-methyltransferase